MTVINGLQDIPELTQPNVHIRNEKELISKINQVIECGAKKLQIVTDFDYTLTRHTMDDGSCVLTSFGMFRECPSIPQDYKEKDNRLAAYYKPIESDPVMPVEEKTQHMIDWYVAARKSLEGLQFPRLELMDIANDMIHCFRSGVRDLICWSQQQQVPVLVFSAGLGECVLAALTAAGLLLPHVKVVSNFLAMDGQDVITGIKGEVIHTYNKNETVIKNTDYYEMVKERNNVILMGDNIGDAGMADGMDHCDVVIKIGFLGHNAEGNLDNYLNKFDIVAVTDHTLDIINAILKRVL